MIEGDAIAGVKAEMNALVECKLVKSCELDVYWMATFATTSSSSELELSSSEFHSSPIWA
jgi:hypothetical protein